MHDLHGKNLKYLVNLKNIENITINMISKKGSTKEFCEDLYIYYFKIIDFYN